MTDATKLNPLRKGLLEFVVLKLVLTDQNDAVSTAGYAIGVLPLPGGAPVPYPFVPKPAYAAVEMPADD